MYVSAFYTCICRSVSYHHNQDGEDRELPIAQKDRGAPVPQKAPCGASAEARFFSLATCHQAAFCHCGLILLSLEFNIQLDLSISSSFSALDSANFSSKTFKKLHLSWTCTHIFHCHYSLKDPTIYITCTSTIYITCTLYQGLWVIERWLNHRGGCESVLCKSRPLFRMLEHLPMLVSVVGRGSGTSLPWRWTVNCIINSQDFGCPIFSNLPTSNKVFVIPNQCLQCFCGPLWTLATTTSKSVFAVVLCGH